MKEVTPTTEPGRIGSQEANNGLTGSARQLRWFLPVIVFCAIAVSLGIGLTLDPNYVPSALVGREVPEFNLQPLPGREPGLSSANLRGEVSMVNVFASWCTSCLEEHPVFMELSAKGAVPIHGINYRDDPDDALAWLDRHGDPYNRIGADRDGRAGIDWGVYGVPETFVVDRNGVVVHKHVGPVTRKALRTTILPLIRGLKEGDG